MRNQKKSNKGVRFLILFLAAIFFGLLFIRNSYWAPISYSNQVIKIEKGDTMAKFYSHLSWMKKNMFKLWLRNHSDKLPIVQEGEYTLDWKYTPEELIELIAQWPKQEYLHITILEWWSKYDIDNFLTSKWLISQWEYISKVDNQSYITSLKNDFPFLLLLPEWKTLEWFLYPDTYYIDKNIPDILDQLIRAQLKNFEKKIWSMFQERLSTVQLPVDLTPYQILILASVIENEEKAPENKSTIAGIFFNRLTKWIALGADVTLCYGLQVTYDNCSSKLTAANIQDTSNKYNTRANAWLMPTPISSPVLETVSAVLDYKRTDDLFYIHDNNWKIHTAKTNEEHNANVQKYLR